MDVALEAPTRVRCLVLASPSLNGYVPDETPPFLGSLVTALQERDFDQANEILLASPVMSVPPAFEEPVRTMVADNSRLWTIPPALVEQPSRPAIERLEEVRTPSLILVGQNDLPAIRAQGALLASRMPNAELVDVAGGGHLLNMTSPDAFREAVSAFLPSVDSR